MSPVNKFIQIRGLYIGVYRSHLTRPVLFSRRIVEPAWIELWFKSTENQWDDMLWDQINDSNQDYFSYCYHITNQKPNNNLEIALSKKYKKIQNRLVLLEGEIVAGNINQAIIEEINSILDLLVNSQQLPQKQASRMKNRIKRTYEKIQKTITN